MNLNDCPLCLTDGGHCLYRSDHLRIIAPQELEFPGLIRVVWHQHLAEMTDLIPTQRSHLMMTVCIVEDIIRKVMQPDKINLAAFGNVVPHLHWHIIPRWHNDPYFPNPIWGAKQRDVIEVQQEWRKNQEKQLMSAIEEYFVSHPQVS